MLKIKLAKEDHAKLPADLQKEYKADGETYILDTDTPFEDVTPLKNALKAEKQHRLEATQKVQDYESKIALLSTEKETLEARALKPSDLEKSYQSKLTASEQAAKARQDQLTGQMRKLLVDNVASQMATEISVAPELILPHIKGRLSIDEVDGQFVTRVLDGDGKASALSVNELKSEFVANKKFAPIIQASKASGGGAQGGQQSGGGAGGKTFAQMNEAEKVTLFKTNRPEFDRLSSTK